jgi:hypothetical protein
VVRITTAEAVQLYGLKIKWDGKYHVSLTHGIWRAIRDTDPLLVLTAASGEELAAKVEADSDR